jgi:hypothetical protein
MKVVKTTPERIWVDRQAHFEALQPEERIRILRAWQERLRKPGVNYSFEGLKVKVVRGKNNLKASDG